MTLPLEEGLRYPFRAERASDLLAIGGALGLAAAILWRAAAAAYPTVLVYALAPLAAVPMVALLGYLLRVFAATLEGADEPPGFGGPRGLLGDGVRALAVAAAYVGTPLAIVLITALGIAGGVSADDLGGGGAAAFLVGSTATLLAVLAFGYVFPAALGAVADGVGVVRALDPRRHAGVLGHAAYFTSWGLAFVVALAGWSLLFGALTSASLYGLLAVFLAFYAHVVATRVVANGYRKAGGAE